MHKCIVTVSACTNGEQVRIVIGSQPDVEIPEDFVVINPAAEGPLPEDQPIPVTGCVVLCHTFLSSLNHKM